MVSKRIMSNPFFHQLDLFTSFSSFSSILIGFRRENVGKQNSFSWPTALDSLIALWKETAWNSTLEAVQFSSPDADVDGADGGDSVRAPPPTSPPHPATHRTAGTAILTMRHQSKIHLEALIAPPITFEPLGSENRRRHDVRAPKRAHHRPAHTPEYRGSSSYKATERTTPGDDDKGSSINNYRRTSAPSAPILLQVDMGSEIPRREHGES